MPRTYRYSADGRTFYVVQSPVRSLIPSWEGRRGSNPLRWFSWEFKDGERDYLACGVKTRREAQEPIDRLCGITG